MKNVLSALSTMASTIALVAPHAAMAAPAAAVSTVQLDAIAAAPRLDRAAVDALYRRALLDGTVASLHDRVEAMVASSAPAHRRAMALLVDALVDWQRGVVPQAEQAVDRALAIEAGPDALLIKAQLLDARGDRAAAGYYDRAAAGLAAPGERNGALLRAALLRAAAGGDATLPTATTPQAGMYLAQVAALLGQPARAAAAFVPDAKAGPVAPQHILVAQWALNTHDWTLARRAAWDAFVASSDPVDQRYALALLAEAWRDAGDLPGLLRFLDGKPAGAVVQDVRLDTLLELRRFDEALALARGGGPALQRRLPAILDLAQRRPALIAEYRRLIAAQPHEARWYDGLAALYLAGGDADAATAVYRQLAGANRGSVPVLTGAARRMIGMGLVDPALEMVRSLGADRAAVVPVQMFLFETYRTQGDARTALEVLDGLDRRLPADSAARIDLADGYEALDRRDRALAVLTGLERAGQALGYDQSVHVAELAVATGHPGDALTRLRRLQASATLPARRTYLNARIAALAQQAGLLDGLTRELDTRLANGTIGSADLELLLRIRENAKDIAGAQAVVARYAAQTGTGDAARLKQLAAVYARQQDYARLNDLYRQLIRIDPGETASYRQRLIQNIVRGRGVPASPAERQRMLAALLADMRNDGGAGGRAFTAGVYEMAGLPEQAIADYRDAFAATPGDTDLVLRLALLLDRQGQTTAALGILQYRAETAPDEATLLAAIDGVVTVVSRGKSGDAGDTAAGRARLLWAQRLLLARIGTRGANAQLLSSLGDVADELGDSELQRRAQEQMLALASGDGRAMLLRQLIAMSTVDADQPTGRAIGDVQGKVRYGRRLIALRRQFPPEVYIDLAGALLTQADVAGAERAFTLLEDIPGLVNTDAARGDAFAAAGYRDRALASYARGLLRDQDDDTLLLKTSILRETMGEAALANRWYWQALRRMFARQPLTGTATDQTQQARWYGETLSEGLVLTWQPGTPAAATILAQLETLVEQALAADRAADRTPWRGQLRLPMLMRLTARIAARADDPGMLDRIAAPLEARFAGDADYGRAMTLLRVRKPRDTSTAAPSLAAAVTADVEGQAVALDDFGLAMALALIRNDAAAIRALVADAIAREARSRDAARTAGDTPQGRVGLPAIDVALLQSSAVLPPDAFRDLVLAPLDRAPFRDLVLFGLFRANPSLLVQLEKAAGRSLIGNDRLATLLVTNDADPVPWLPRTGERTDNPLVSIPQRFSVDERLALYDAYVTRNRTSGQRSFLQGGLAADLLEQSLDAAQQSRFLATLAKDLALAPDAGADRTDIWPGLLLVPDAPAGRFPLLIGAAEAVAVRYPDQRYIAAVLRALAGGERQAAFDLLMQRYEGLAAPAGSSDATPTLVKAHFADEWRRGAAAFMADASPAPETIDRFYRRYVVANRYGTFGGSDDERRDYLQRLVTLRPDDPTYVADLAQSLFDKDRAALATVLASYVARHPDDQEAATDLQLVHLLSRNAAAAADVARASGVNAGNPDWLVQLTNRAKRDQPGGPPTFRRLFERLYGTLETEQPSFPAVVAVRKRRAIDRVGASRANTAAPYTPFIEAVARDPATAPAILREIWRNSAAESPEQQDGGVSRAGLLQALPHLDDRKTGEEADDPRLIEALVSTPAVTDELETELAGMEPVRQQAQRHIYVLIAEGMARQGRADAQIAALLATLADGPIGRHRLQLLVTLLDRQRRTLDDRQVAALGSTMLQTANIGAMLHAGLARVFATAGDFATAQALVEASAAQSLFPPTGYIVAASDHVTPRALVRDLKTWTDRSAAQRAYQRLEAILNIARKSGGVPAADNILPPLDPA